MDDIIFNLKNIVVVILAAEFMKNLMASTKYKKYINFALSIVVIGFLLSSFTGMRFDRLNEQDFNYTENISTENMIATEYKRKIAEKISESFPKDSFPEFSIELDDNYNVVKLSVKTDYKNAEKILNELGFVNYEVIN